MILLALEQFLPLPIPATTQITLFNLVCLDDSRYEMEVRYWSFYVWTAFLDSCVTIN